MWVVDDRAFLIFIKKINLKIVSYCLYQMEVYNLIMYGVFSLYSRYSDLQPGVLLAL